MSRLWATPGTPQHDFADCLLALDPQQRARLKRSEMAQERIADYRIMNIDFYPRESHLVTFRDPWSFPVLFHPGCNNLIRRHLEELAQKVRIFCLGMAFELC